MQSSTQAHEGREEILAQVAQEVAAAILPRGARRDRLGEVFLACEAIAREDTEAFDGARADGDLVAFLAPRVRTQLGDESGERFRGGWMGTYVGADGRDLEADADPERCASADPEQLDLGRRALKRAQAAASDEGNQTLQRYLRWYQQRLAQESYAAIARREGRPAATIRTGVARARKHVLRMVQELQHAQPAPLTGDAPPEIEPLRALWVAQDLDALEAGLDATREGFRDDPHWLNLSALLRAVRGEFDRALALYERALIFADAPSVRARVLNNLGNLCDDRERKADARHYWLRAHQLLPEAPAPLMNLLAAAAAERDYAGAQHWLGELGEGLSNGRFEGRDRDYVLRRLGDNPGLAWLRETEAWRLGPARWLRAARRGARAVAATLALALAVLIPTVAPAAHGGATPAPASAATAELPGDISIARGGDSMGGPRRGGRGRRSDEARTPLRLAGDSMGLLPRGGKRRG